jgi:hypothetical protein
MENLFVLPTNKPSRLHYFSGNSAGYYLYDNKKIIIPRNQNCKNQNIYITSDEDIKVGDWCYQVELNDGKIYKCYDIRLYHNTYKKIAITTDQELIKEGVAAIDEDFLEWFVNNPNCDKVYYYNVYLNDKHKIVITHGKLKIEPCVSKISEEKIELLLDEYSERFDLTKSTSLPFHFSNRNELEELINEVIKLMS